MKKEFFEVVDMVGELCSVLESLDVVTFDFYSENYLNFDDTLGTYKLMKCKFESNSVKMEIIRDLIIGAIKKTKELKRRVEYCHKNM